MRRLLPWIPLLFLTFLSFQVSAQDDKPRYPRSYVKIGLNAGGAWLCSDVRCRPGGGAGLTVEVPLIENARSPIGLSIRGRYLGTVTRGLDWQPDADFATNSAVNGDLDSRIDYRGLGYYYANHRTGTHEWSAELMLTANRLRARTGWLLYIYGGVGTQGYLASTQSIRQLFRDHV